MKQKLFILIISLVMPFMTWGQTYSALWKKVDEAEKKDLPQTMSKVLQEIVDKATAERAYGQLLKAELKNAQVKASVAPDSLKPAMERISQRCENTKDVVLKTVYQTVLFKVYTRNLQLEVTPVKPVLTEEICRQLAQVKDETYNPFVVEGEDSKLFNHDMLIVVGKELEDYEPLYNYYKQSGNRQAACLMAAKAYQWDAEKLDSLMEVYGDLPEAGDLAIAYYKTALIQKPDEENVEKARFIDMALRKWGGWRHMNTLRNLERDLTNPQFRVNYDCEVNQPMQAMPIKLEQLRNLKSLTLKVYPVKANGDIDFRPNYADGYKKIKPLLGTPITVEKAFAGKRPYELFEDSLTLEGLPIGVYMLEFSTIPSTEIIRLLYFVTDVYTIAESQPDSVVRYVTVSATTGQPIAGAHLRIKEFISYNKFDTSKVRTNAKGEYLFKRKNNGRCEVFAYTDNDKACPEMNVANRYRYYKNNDQPERTEVYTDRAIYRPGQTVHVAAMIYQVLEDCKHAAKQGKRVTFSLRDANRKELKTVTATTDGYGVCSADFTLPSSGLTGEFSVRVNGRIHNFRVEEYKRPTFQVEFQEVKQHYEAGDTVEVKGIARTYAGVPVQGANVEYTVDRRMAFWWWSYSRYYDTGILGIGNDSEDVFSGEAVTDSDGSFTVKMPMIMPESEHPLFYNFTVMADVTDTAGETHNGQYTLPLGNRKTALSIDIEEKMLLEDNPKMTFHLRNAAGKDIDAKVKYQIDGGKWLTANTHESLSVPSLKSGKHTVEAICEGDTLKRDFVVFSLDDKRPAIETDDWSYQRDFTFPNDGKPVTIQVGSSDKDVHIVYSIFAADRLIETGAVDKTNELINRKFTYKEEYGDGIVLNFAWVKNGKCYTHEFTINRPKPDKKLKLQWTTFRDRLTPGQEEEWTLTVMGPDGKPADAMLMATLYDQSLDQLRRNVWTFYPYTPLSLPSVQWTVPSRYPISLFGSFARSRLAERSLALSHFDSQVFPSYRSYKLTSIGSVRRLRGAAVLESNVVADGLAIPQKEISEQAIGAFDVSAMEGEDATTIEEALQGRIAGLNIKSDNGDLGSGGSGALPEVQIRENLNETAFFYPQLTTDTEGKIALKFTLPESLTTWHFIGLAHTKDMCYGMLEGEAVAKKDVMIQPNMPRFVREGDKAVLTARIFNTSDHSISGKAHLKLTNPETEAMVFETTQAISVSEGATGSVSFELPVLSADVTPLVCQVMAYGEGFSDGEQHYLPVLPSTERVTVTVPFTQNELGKRTIDLAALLPVDSKTPKLTFEYTNNPAWLMIQALPTVGKPSDDDAISQAASFYANSIGKHILTQNPKAKTAFQLWQQERLRVGDGMSGMTGSETSLMSALEKNQELKDLMLNETPWVMDADRETEQKQRLADFFDESIMQQRLEEATTKLKKLQCSDGSWSWWPEMPGSFYMTVAISEMLVRLNSLTDEQPTTESMLKGAFKFMGKEIVKEVKELKKLEKKGHKPGFPSFKCLQWLYLSTLDGRTLPTDVQEANAYLLKLLKKEIGNQSIYEKAMTAVILSKTDPVRSKEYVKSLKEYTVYREEMGRYYDTPRAGYSWFDYKIPTQTMAIEALQRITPDDQQTIQEMQRWLLQSKRTQAWDTPINSVNAVYAFLNGQSLALTSQEPVFTVDNQPLETPKATAAIGYVKTTVEPKSKLMTIEKTSKGTSWGAVYAQFYQPSKSIKDSGYGLTVKREVLVPQDAQAGTFKVGDRIRIRLTIEADRDYDFVQIVDRRAACMEPVKQLSGYHSGSYCTPRDHTTNYYFDRFSKGKHVIETEYYIDRPGTYETGSCTVMCAYAPEFRGTTKSQTIIVK